MAGRVVQAVVGLVLGATVLWPQPGYIHPDEFFQSTEVVAGDIFNISHLRTWEFHPDLPLRDIFLPYLLFAPGFYCLRATLNYSHLSHYVVESYTVLVLPRLMLALAGLVNYCLVRKLCQVFSDNEGTAVWLWMTSYATWTFLTRPFSNTTETLLFSVVNILLLQTSQCCRSTKHVDTAAKMIGREFLSWSVKLCSILLGVALCMGFFNRPTFALFVFVPLLWWVDQLCSVGKKMWVMVIIFLTGTGFLLMFAVLSLANSLYYNPDFAHLVNDFYTSLSQWDVEGIHQSAHSIVGGLRIPFWSFIQFNLLSVNLAEHGLHPWYTHFLVHLPMLLGPLVLLFYTDVLGLIVHCRQRHHTDVLYATVIIPVIFLSAFPHQEARFLLPVLPFAVVCAAKNSLTSWKSFKAVVLVFNILGFVLLGWLHQGGLVSALSAFQGRLKKECVDPSNFGAHYHIVSYTTYMSPRHILFTNQSTIQVHVHDMIGAHNHPPTLQYRMDQVHSSCQKDSIDCHFWLLFPAPALPDITTIQGWQLKEEGEFCPHVSMERLPANFQTWEDVSGLMSQLCLKVVSVKMKS